MSSLGSNDGPLWDLTQYTMLVGMKVTEVEYETLVMHLWFCRFRPLKTPSAHKHIHHYPVQQETFGVEQLISQNVCLMSFYCTTHQSDKTTSY